MEVRRLFMGSMNGFLGDAMPFNGYAILHPDGVVLVDTAFGAVFGKGPSGAFVYGPDRWEWMARSTLAGLADHDIEPGDVKYVINTHLGDHSGENYLFPDATFIVQQPEVTWTRQNMPQEWLEPWDFPGAKLEQLQGEDAEILPGITCLFTPGHTPGHQSVIAHADTGKHLFVGDAVYNSDIWDDLTTMTEEHPAWESQQGPGGYETWLASAEKLRHASADVVHFAHDTAIVHRH